MSGWEREGAHNLDCKTVGFFLKLSKEIGKAWSKEIGKAWRKSLTRAKRELTVVYQ